MLRCYVWVFDKSFCHVAFGILTETPDAVKSATWKLEEENHWQSSVGPSHMVPYHVGATEFGQLPTVNTNLRIGTP